MNEEKLENLLGDERLRAIHFVGIGGTGMSALARIALEMGYRVSGSDLNLNAATDRLSREGARISPGHHPENSRGADLVIYSSAVARGNAEIQAAREARIPIFHRSDFLAFLMSRKSGIAVAGSHGKTSTAALIAWILKQAGWEPSFAIGGEVIDLGTNGAWGSGDWLVAEADESDGSFRKFAPAREVITGLDLDHVDYYPTWERLRDAFQTFIGRLEPEGTLFACADDPRLMGMLPPGPRFLTYGLSEKALFRARNVNLGKEGSSFKVEKRGGELGRVRLQLLGEHNVVNALAAIALSLEIGVPFAAIAEALSVFRGVRRRLEIKAILNGITVVEDYSHHPAEIRTALNALLTTRPRELWCVFQPHRYSRLSFFAREIAGALLPADHLIITELYPAFEKPRAGVNSSLLTGELGALGHRSVSLLEKDRILNVLIKRLKSGDTVVIMGAGDIGGLAGELAKRMESFEHD